MLVTNVAEAVSKRIAGVVIDPFVSRIILESVAARVELLIIEAPAAVVKFPKRRVPVISPVILILPVPVMPNVFNGKLAPRPVVAVIVPVNTALPVVLILPVPTIFLEFKVKFPPKLGLVSVTRLVNPVELAVSV